MPYVGSAGMVMAAADFARQMRPRRRRKRHLDRFVLVEFSTNVTALDGTEITARFVERRNFERAHRVTR